MPQEWGSHWPLGRRERRCRGASGTDAADASAISTLVTPEFNTKLSNRDFKTKKKEIKRTSRLLLNRRFGKTNFRTGTRLQFVCEVESCSISRGGDGRIRRRQQRLRAWRLDLPPDKSGRISDDEDVIDEPPIRAQRGRIAARRVRACSKRRTEGRRGLMESVMTDNVGQVDAVLFKRWTDAVALREAMTELEGASVGAPREGRGISATVARGARLLIRRGRGRSTRG